MPMHHCGVVLSWLKTTSPLLHHCFIVRPRARKCNAFNLRQAAPTLAASLSFLNLPSASTVDKQPEQHLIYWFKPLTMKISLSLSLSALAVALTSVADAAAQDKCTPGQLEKIVALLSTSSKDHVRNCQSASGGFSIFPPAAKSPTDDQVKSMCASSACLDLLGDVLGSGLVDCVLEWDGKSLNPHDMALSFQTICGLINSTGSTDSSSAGSKSERLRRARSVSNTSSSAVEAGVVETYRPERTHSEQFMPSLACTNYAHGYASPEVSIHPTPAVTDKTDWPHTKYPTPTPTNVKHKTYQPDGGKHTRYPTPVPKNVKHKTHQPDDGSHRKPHHYGHASSPPPYDRNETSSKPQPELYSTPTVTASSHDQYTTPAPTYGPRVPPKPQWVHGMTHTPGDNWYERDVRQTSEVDMDEVADYEPGHFKPDEEEEDTGYEPEHTTSNGLRA
jgi:hypothetical protein